MPDGTSSIVQRAVAVFDSGALECPRCSHRIRITVGEGDVLLTCERRDRGIICGQKIGVVGIRGRLCLVVALSASEFVDLQGSDLQPGILFRRLDLVGRALMPAGAA